MTKGRVEDRVAFCPRCGWTESCRAGDLIVSKTQDGECVSHRVIKW